MTPHIEAGYMTAIPFSHIEILFLQNWADHICVKRYFLVENFRGISDYVCNSNIIRIVHARLINRNENE